MIDYKTDQIFYRYVTDIQKISVLEIDIFFDTKVENDNYCCKNIFDGFSSNQWISKVVCNSQEVKIVI